jgi:hypothetical protein
MIDQFELGAREVRQVGIGAGLCFACAIFVAGFALGILTTVWWITP